MGPLRVWTLLGACLAGWVVSTGCALENPDHVQDSTGAETGWACARGSCDTVRESFSAAAPECDGDGTELRVGAGAIAILCAVSEDAEGEEPRVHDETCRPLVCADALDCPQWSGRPYVCVEEVCQVEEAAGWRLDALDMTALCLWDIARHGSCTEALDDPRVQARVRLAREACAGEGGCASVPDPCLAP